MEERRQEARAVPEGERTMRAETPPTNVTPMMRGEYMPAWYSRISWGSVLAGVFVAVATQFVLSAVGVLVGFGVTSITSLAALKSASAGVGIWAAISALISLFIGGYVAARLANSLTSANGLWHGLIVWAFALVVGILLSSLGVTGLLGLGSATATARGIIPTGTSVTPADLKVAASLASRTAGYFLLGSLLSLAASLLGGWLGSNRLSRAEAMRRAETERTRMAA